MGAISDMLAGHSEDWKPVMGFEDLYAVSSLGRIRRIKRSGNNTKIGYIKKPTSFRGYLRYSLWRDGRGYSCFSHRLVALAFLGSPPEGKPDINHKNGLKADNRPENLEFVNAAENNAHAILLGLVRYASGEQHGHAKLTQAEVQQIKCLKGSLSTRAVARLFGISQYMIWAIWRGRNWSHA